MKKTLITLAAQPALVGIILSVVIRQLPDWPHALRDKRLTAYFFFLMVAAFWFGDWVVMQLSGVVDLLRGWFG